MKYFYTVLVNDLMAITCSNKKLLLFWTKENPQTYVLSQCNSQNLGTNIQKSQQVMTISTGMNITDGLLAPFSYPAA